MKLRKHISCFFTVTFTSFTVIMLLYATLWSENGISPRTVYGLFSVCAVIGVAVLLTDLIPIQSVIVRLAINFLDAFLTVFLFGGCVLKLFPFSVGVLLSVFGMLTAAYAVVVAAVMVNEKLCSEEINHKLAEMKNQNRSRNG